MPPGSFRKARNQINAPFIFGQSFGTYWWVHANQQNQADRVAEKRLFINFSTSLAEEALENPVPPSPKKEWPLHSKDDACTCLIQKPSQIYQL